MYLMTHSVLYAWPFCMRGMSFQLGPNLAKEYNGRNWFVLLNSLNSASIYLWEKSILHV